MTAVLRIPGFLTADACVRAREQYARWLAKGEAAPRGTLTTDVSFRLVNAAAAVAVGKKVGDALREHFGTCPLKLDYAAYTRILPGGSHELHADAVLLDGVTPNHTPTRVCTGIVYLTAEGQDHDGGTIRFPEYDLTVPPSPGLLVGFLSGVEHRHEVSAVARGERDALAFWFLKDCGCGCK